MNSAVDAIMILRTEQRHLLEQVAKEFLAYNEKSEKPLTIQEWLDHNAEVWGNRLVNQVFASENHRDLYTERIVTSWIGIVASALKSEGLID